MLYREFYVPLYCLCRRIFNNDHDAVEAVNDGMLKVFRNIGNFQQEKGRFFNWIYTIVRNTALDKFRTNQTIPARPALEDLGETIPDQDPGQNPINSLEEKDIYILLDGLNPATRVVCTLFYLEGYPVRDIAEKLSISEGTVKWHCSEARKKLRPIFERHLNESS